MSININFSIVNMRNLDDAQKKVFYKELSILLDFKINEIRTDDVLCDFQQQITKLVETNNADSIVASLYSAITAGIQTGSGNQSLYLDVLKAITDSWNKVTGK